MDKHDFHEAKRYMQTITLEVNDGFLSKFMSLLETIPKDQVKIKTDRYSEEIAKRLKSIDSGDYKLTSHSDFWGKFDDRVASFKNAH